MKWIKTCSTKSEERFSNLAVIVMYYSKRFAQIEVEVDKICQEALVRTHPRRPFQASLFDWISYRQVKKETNNYHCCTVLVVLRLGMGAHNWVAGICQPWGSILARGWLTTVEAPGYPIPGTHLPLKRGSWLNIIMISYHCYCYINHYH